MEEICNTYESLIVHFLNLWNKYYAVNNEVGFLKREFYLMVADNTLFIFMFGLRGLKRTEVPSYVGSGCCYLGMRNSPRFELDLVAKFLHVKKCIADTRLCLVRTAIFMLRICNNIAGTAICFFIPATHFSPCTFLIFYVSLEIMKGWTLAL